MVQQNYIMKELKTKTELALEMGCGEATVNRWIAAGCPHERKAINSRRVRPYFDLAAVRAWLETRAAGKEVEV